jgi:hypothetical protein
MAGPRPSQRFPTARLAGFAALFSFFLHLGTQVPVNAEDSMAFNFSLNWGTKAPATPPPLPPVQQKSGGSGDPFFNRLIGGAGLENNQLRRPLAQSVWVMSAISKVAEPICAVPMEFKMMDADGSEKPYVNPALKAFWTKPAKGLSRDEFLRASVGWWNLKGEVFYILDDSWLLRTATKSPLIVAKPSEMREVVEDGELIGWEWTQANGKRQLLIPDQVIQVKRWNPDNKWRGLSKMEAAMIAAEADYLQGVFSANLARNNGDQGVFVIAKGNMPTEEQQKQIIMMLREKREAARRGELRPAFLAGDIEIKDPLIQTPDADFVAQRMGNRHEIYIAFGVPPSMADVVASYSIGAASDRYILIEDTCMPLAKTLGDTYAEISLRYLRMDPATPLSCAFNFSKHSVMAQARLEMLGAADKLWAKGVPMKECNDYLGLGLPEYEGWDVGYLPINVSPVGEDEDPSQTFAENTPPPANNGTDPADDDVQELQKIFAQRNGTAGAVAKSSEAARQRLWKKHMAQRMPSVRRYRTALNKCLAGARADMLGKLAAHHQMTGRSIVAKSGASSAFMFNLHDFAAEFKTAMDACAHETYTDAGQQLYDEIGKDDPWVSPPAKVKEFIAQRENRLKNVPQEIFNQIKRQLDAGVDAGDSIRDIAKRVSGEFDVIESGRARTIATTEVGAGYGSARDASMKAAGIKHKEWLTSGNSNVREAHAEAEGQVRAIDEPYDVDGEEIDFPGDPDGSAENVINCHCVSIAGDEEDA